MKRGQSLFGGLVPDGGNMVSPLVDVVFNLMITMFVFLMIYMAVVIPKKESDVDFMGIPVAAAATLPAVQDLQAQPHKSLPSYQLPDATVYGDYHANIPVFGGQGLLSFVVSQELQPLPLTIGAMSAAQAQPQAIVTGTRDGVQTLHLERVGVLTVEAIAGRLQAKFFASALGSQPSPRTVSFYATVIDNRKHLKKSPSQCEQWGDAWLYFYQESQDRPTPFGTSQSVECVQAVRAQFSIKVHPQSIPFDPHSHPLRLALPAKSVDAIEGMAISEAVAVVGGLQPYEFQLRGTPGWLAFDPATATFTAARAQRGTFELNIEVKDRQTPKSNWLAARASHDEVGRPHASGVLRLNVQPVDPLRVTLQRPEYSRVGVQASGAVLNEGGYGAKRFEAKGLPLGLVIDERSGKITGIPTVMGHYRVDIKVTDKHPDERRRTATTTGDWRIIAPMPSRGFQGRG